MKRVYKMARIDAPRWPEPAPLFAALLAGTWAAPDGWRVVSHSVDFASGNVSLLLESTVEDGEPSGAAPYR